MDAFGDDLGGMLVSLAGKRADGSRARIEWHLTADAQHGPEIPCMAAVLLARKLAQAASPSPARTLHGISHAAGISKRSSRAGASPRW